MEGWYGDANRLKLLIRCDLRRTTVCQTVHMTLLRRFSLTAADSSVQGVAGSDFLGYFAGLAHANYMLVPLPINYYTGYCLVVCRTRASWVLIATYSYTGVIAVR